MDGYEGHIGVLPSKGSKFNAMKSNLKVLEYAVLGIPVLCSKEDPYMDMPVNYFSGEKEFVREMTRLVEDKDYREECGQRLQKFCIDKYSLNPKTRIDVFEKIIKG